MDESSPKRFRPPTEDATSNAQLQFGPKPVKAPVGNVGRGSGSAAGIRARGRGGRYPFTPQNSFADARRQLAALHGGTTPEPLPPVSRPPLLPTAVEASSVSSMEMSAATNNGNGGGGSNSSDSAVSGMPFNSHDIMHMVAMKRLQLEDRTTHSSTDEARSIGSLEASDYDSDVELSDIEAAQAQKLDQSTAYASDERAIPGLSPNIGNAQRPIAKSADTSVTSRESAQRRQQQQQKWPSEVKSTSAADNALFNLIGDEMKAFNKSSAKSASHSPTPQRKSLFEPRSGGKDDDDDVASNDYLSSCYSEARRHTISVSGRDEPESSSSSAGHSHASSSAEGMTTAQCSSSATSGSTFQSTSFSPFSQSGKTYLDTCACASTLERAHTHWYARKKLK